LITTRSRLRCSIAKSGRWGAAEPRNPAEIPGADGSYTVMLLIQLAAGVLVRGASGLDSRSADNIFCGLASPSYSFRPRTSRSREVGLRTSVGGGESAHPDSRRLQAGESTYAPPRWRVFAATEPRGCRKKSEILKNAPGQIAESPVPWSVPCGVDKVSGTGGRGRRRSARGRMARIAAPEVCRIGAVLGPHEGKGQPVVV
jgi:hypothetical protein